MRESFILNEFCRSKSDLIVVNQYAQSNDSQKSGEMAWLFIHKSTKDSSRKVLQRIFPPLP